LFFGSVQVDWVQYSAGQVLHVLTVQVAGWCRFDCYVGVQKAVAVRSAGGFAAPSAEVSCSAADNWDIIQSSAAAAAAVTEATWQIAWWQPVLWWDQLSHRSVVHSLSVLFWGPIFKDS